MTTIRTAPNRWVRIPEPLLEARTRLFCLPYAGVGISAFRGWSSPLRPDVEVCLIQLPGREDRLSEPRFTRLTELVPSLLTALYPYLDRPFALFGHSMGGLIAFELTRALRREGGPLPSKLCISARKAPQLRETSVPLHDLPDAGLVEKIRRLYDGIPQVILDSPELLRLFLPTLRADLEFCETYIYRPEPPLACPIAAFGGLNDRLVKPGDVEAWREHSTNGFALTLLSGGHFFLKEARADLLAALSVSVAGELEGNRSSKSRSDPP